MSYTAYFRFRLSNEDQKKIRELAKQNGLTISEYIRLKSLGKKLKKAKRVH